MIPIIGPNLLAIPKWILPFWVICFHSPSLLRYVKPFQVWNRLKGRHTEERKANYCKGCLMKIWWFPIITSGIGDVVRYLCRHWGQEAELPHWTATTQIKTNSHKTLKKPKNLLYLLSLPVDPTVLCLPQLCFTPHNEIQGAEKEVA